MFDLSTASISIRKAAALNGVWSGKWEPVFDPADNGHPGAVVAKVYNKNHPDGIEILEGEAAHALDYTWDELR